MLSGNPAFPAKPGKAFRKRAEREEREALAPGEVSRNYVSDRCQVRLERVPQLIAREVASHAFDPRDVDSQRERLDPDAAEIALGDEFHQACLVRDVLKVVTEQPFVSPVGRRGDTKDAGTLKIPEHALIAFRKRMLAFVDDDQREMIGRKPTSPVLAGQCLHGGNDDRRLEAGSAFGCLDLGYDTGCS